MYFKALQWPVLMLYDEYSQSDYVESFDERASLQEQLEIMFPADRHAEWDEECKYTWDKLVVYLERYHGDGNKDTRMVQVATDAPLIEALQGMRVPQCLTLHVLADRSPALESFCRAHHMPPPFTKKGDAAPPVQM